MKNGFTLIELLVVVLIIGILAAIALPQYTVAVKKSRLAAYFPLVKAMADAEEVFFLNNNVYTGNVSELDVAFPEGYTLAGGATDDGYIKYADGTVLDLLGGSNHMAEGSANAYISVTLPEGGSYVHYLNRSSTPGRRTCAGDEKVCKSFGGRLLSGSTYELP